MAASLCAMAMLSVLTVGLPAMAQAEPKSKPGKESFEGEQQWRAFFHEAKTAYGERRYAEAKSLLLKASAIKMTPKILGNLAQAEIQLGDYKAAAAHATEALAAGKSPTSAEDLALASKYVGKLTLGVNVEGASVRIDGEDVGMTSTSKVVFVDPGLRKIVLSKAGYATTEKELVVQKGTAQQVDFELVEEKRAPEVVPEKAAPAPEKKPEIPQAFEEPKREPPKPHPVLLVAGGVVAVSGIVTGFIFNSMANSASDKAEELNGKVRSYRCNSAPTKFAEDCAALMDHRQERDSDRNISTVAFLVGGAAAVGTVLYWVWPRSKASASATGVHVTGVAAPGGSWLGLAGSF